jgi:hypothetical protein
MLNLAVHIITTQFKGINKITAHARKNRREIAH